MNDSSDELLSAATRFDDELKQHNTASWKGTDEHSRIKSVLKLLHATLRGGASTQSLTLSDSNRDHLKPPPSVPDQVGRFVIGRCVGQGGFGTVYQAHDQVLGRDVALKLVARRDSSATKDESTATGETPAFQDDSRWREARAAARLNHPNLVPLYEVIDDEEFVCLISEFCEGQTLQQYLNDESAEAIPAAWAAEIMLKLSRAIAHAHGRGLVHRDIKPSNIILVVEQAQGELLPFTPRLTDFGLVVDVNADGQASTGDALAGTILYMAPEQIIGVRDVDAKRSDVYSLGLVLYVMLMGGLPYRDDTPAGLLRQICLDPIGPLLNKRQDIPRDLRAICERAMQKDAQSRYASASELVDDLARFREGRSVAARPRRWPERAFRTVRGAPWLSAISLALVGIVITSAVVLAIRNRQLRQQGEALKRSALTALQNELHAERQQSIAESTQQKALETAYRSDLVQAFTAVERNDYSTATSIVDDIEQYGPEEWARRLDLRLLRQLCRGEWRELKNAGAPVGEIVPFANQPLVAVGGGAGVVQLLNANDGHCVREIEVEPGKSISALAVSPDESCLAVGVSGNALESWMAWWPVNGDTVSVIELDGLRVRQRFNGFAATIDSLAFLHQSDQLAVGTRYEPIDIFNLASGEKTRTLEAARRNEDLFCQPDDELSWLVQSQSIHIVSLAEKTQQGDEEPGRDWVASIEDDPLYKNQYFNRMARSDDGRWVVGTIRDGSEALLWDRTQRDRLPRVLTNSHGRLSPIRFSPDGRHIAAGTHGGGVVIWHLDERESAIEETDERMKPLLPSRHLVMHDSPVSAICIRDDETVISGSDSGQVMISGGSFFPSRSQEFTLDRDSNVADLSPDGTFAILGGGDGSVWRLDLATRGLHCLLPADEAMITAISISPDGQSVVVGNLTGRVMGGTIADPSDWKPLPECDLVSELKTGVSELHFTQDSSRVVANYTKATLQFFDFGLRQSLSIYRAPTAMQSMTVLDRDTVVTMNEHSYLADVKTTVLRARNGVSQGRSQCYDATHQIIYVGGYDGRIRAADRDAIVHETSRSWNSSLSTSHTSRVITAIACSPDGRNLLTGGDNGEVGLWDAGTLRFLGTIWKDDDEEHVQCLRFSDDGQTIMAHRRKLNSTTPGIDGRLRWIRLDPL